MWKRSVQSVVREALLREREVQAASDKAACWRSLRDDVLKDLLLLVLLLDRTAAAAAADDEKAAGGDLDGAGGIAVARSRGRLPKGVPPLFSLQAPLKSSREVRW